MDREEEQKGAQRGLGSGSGAHGEAGIHCLVTYTSEWCPAFHRDLPIARAVPLPPCALQVPGQVEEGGETKGLPRAPASWSLLSQVLKAASGLLCAGEALRNLGQWNKILFKANPGEHPA